MDFLENECLGWKEGGGGLCYLALTYLNLDFRF